ncbi:MAG: hypothetical protein AB7L76_22795, partial [Burkholderiaceae bacterium]
APPMPAPPAAANRSPPTEPSLPLRQQRWCSTENIQRRPALRGDWYLARDGQAVFGQRDGAFSWMIMRISKLQCFDASIA